MGGGVAASRRAGAQEQMGSHNESEWSTAWRPERGLKRHLRGEGEWGVPQPFPGHGVNVGGRMRQAASNPSLLAAGELPLQSSSRPSAARMQPGMVLCISLT